MSNKNDFAYGVWQYISNYYNFDKSSAVDMVFSTIEYFTNIYGYSYDAKKCVLNCLNDKIDESDLEKIFDYLEKEN